MRLSKSCPPETVDSLLKVENKTLLTKVLTYHVVAGRLSGSDLMARSGKEKAPQHSRR